MRRPRVLVVGAGMGGLVCALELARRGAQVTVLERAAEIGGKMATVAVEGRAIDCGPTVLTMRWVFEALFRGAGLSLESEVELRPSARVGRHLFFDGSVLDLWMDLERSAEEIRELSGPRDAAAFLRFAAHTAEIYRAVREPFLLSPRPTPLDLARSYGLGALSRLWSIDGARTLATALRSTFEDPRLRQLFGRYATYVGSSPFQTPATLGLIAHVELAGVWFVEGGMRRLAEAVGRAAQRHGALIETRAGVQRIQVEGGRAVGVILDDGRSVRADAIVYNGAAEALAAGLLGPGLLEPAKARPASLSAITWAAVARLSGPPLVRHNVLFSEDSSAEFTALKDRAPPDPTIYLCAQDRYDTAGPGGDRERLLILMNAPARPERFDEEELNRCEERMLTRLARAGIGLEAPGWIRAGPPAFSARYPGTDGALYGMAAHGTWSAFQRHAHQSSTPGLYLAGGTVHPGPGVPMAALSGMIAARAAAADLRSTLG